MKHGTPSQANRGPKNPGRSWERAKFAKPPAAIVVAFNSILEFDKRSHNR